MHHVKTMLISNNTCSTVICIHYHRNRVAVGIDRALLVMRCLFDPISTSSLTGKMNDLVPIVIALFECAKGVPVVRADTL